ncbi:MAG: helix-turn-helix domain-containing protein [Dactylosporangium sp.]|nr:helix-turn-helix domain-containing protein [Dactylosporangium sp.]NNJ61913.1 helix-turn-helix domain-containing protein [Dactylosporangium sp.]
MPTTARRSVGTRVASARLARGMTQQDLATASQVSLSMVRKVEQGSRIPSDGVVQAIASVLRLDPARLWGEDATTGARIHDAIPALRSVIDAYDCPADGPVRPLAQLHSIVNSAVMWRLSARYSRLAETMPACIAELIRAVHATTGPERVQAAALLTAAYRSVDGVAFKYGYHDLSARLIELMRHTATVANDDLLIASTVYVRMETFFASGDLRTGLRLLDRAADVIAAPSAPRATAVLGAIQMRAAVAAGRIGDATAARGYLREAHSLAAGVPDGVYYGTAFGPASLKIHELSVAVELGDAPGALDAARGWLPPVDLPAERRSHYFIDLARAQLWSGYRERAVESLQTARQIAPQHVREHRHARQTLERLVQLHRKPSAQLVSLAHWAKVV